MPTSSHRELLGHVLAAMGVGSTLVALSGCEGDIADTGSSQNDASSDQAPTDVSQPDPPLSQPPIIIRPRPTSDADIDADRYCRGLVTRREQTLEYLQCPADGGDGGDRIDPRANRTYACLPAPPMGQSCSDTYSESCVLNTYTCGLAVWGQRVLCGPLPGLDGECCYITEGSCPVGRPFLVDGIARFAPAENEPSWPAALSPNLDALDDHTRVALADVWTQDGLTEHASVASFCRFVLQCLSVGAPADIVQGAQQACADEIEHARIAFGLASAYAGRPIGPGRLDVKAALDDHLDTTDIACSVASEGCIAELVSAALIVAARDEARDPVVKSVLARVAEQELAHALLAWRYLAWACNGGDAQLCARVARVFAHKHEQVGFGARTSLPANADQMRAHGYLPITERRQIANAVLIDVIRPAARALFANTTAEAAPLHDVV